MPPVPCLASPLRHVLRAFAVVMSAWALTAWAQAPVGQAGPGFRLAVSKSPLSLPVLVAAAQGFFADEGLALTIVDCVGGHRCLALMRDGQADLATAGDTPFVFHSFAAGDFVILATMASTVDDLKLFTHRAAGIARPRDLAGRRIGAVVGTASQYFLDSLLLVHGVDPRSVQVVPLQPEQMQRALESREVDAVAVWEPYGYRIARDLKDQAVAVPNAGIYTGTFNLVAQRRLVGARDADLVRLLRAIARAEDFIREHPARSQAVLRERLGTDDDFVRWVWPGMVYRLSLDQTLVKTLESEARWALREGHVSGRSAPNFLNLLHRGPLLQVRPAAVGIAR